MLVFNKISYKNFLSSGNAGIEIPLNKYKSTLLCGKNANGKSTILDALTFVLFGKPFRNITKPQLINSINKKALLVEIEFTNNTDSYLVRRGMKPNIFEIFCNGKLINQNAATKDYQKVLEQQILKISYNAFTQVIILGSATYIPFMQLPPVSRREVIEEILDIRVFSIMNNILKEKIVITKERSAELQRKSQINSVKVDYQQKLVDMLVNNHQNMIDELHGKMNTNTQLLNYENMLLTEKQNYINELQLKISNDQYVDAIEKLNQCINSHNAKLSHLNTSKKLFEDNAVCPSCHQDIDQSHKDSILTGLLNEKTILEEKIQQYNDLHLKINDKIKNAQAYTLEYNKACQEAQEYLQKIKSLTSQNDDLNTKINELTSASANIQEEKTKLDQLHHDAKTFDDDKIILVEEQQLQDISSILLKDTGIKTTIIDEYLPVINRLINSYLAEMDFFVRFELQSDFQERIKSRERDIFTYESFSEGEKRRLDLAILFTWRQIAKMKNSINTNIMFLDEVLDGSLDASGIDYFLSAMGNSLDAQNIFVISHRDVADKFDHVIKFNKKNDFSYVEEES